MFCFSPRLERCLLGLEPRPSCNRDQVWAPTADLQMWAVTVPSSALNAFALLLMQHQDNLLVSGAYETSNQRERDQVVVENLGLLRKKSTNVS